MVWSMSFTAHRKPKTELKLDKDVVDNARFLRSWLQRPLTTGAVSPSGKMLARTMASFVDPRSDGPVIELGPGTGPVTEALVQHGVKEERLFLLEYSPDFCKLLRERFPKATIVEGDAYAIGETFRTLLSARASAILSSLPLLTKPEERRIRLLSDAFSLAEPNAPFIQFTYGTQSPMPILRNRFSAQCSQRIWLNIPPARVWVYRDIALARRQAAVA